MLNRGDLLPATTLRTRLTAIGGVIVFLVVAGAWIALTHASAQSTQAARKTAAHRSSASQAATGPLQVTSVTPARRAAQVSGTAAIEVSFSAPLAATSPLPTIRPSIAGNWQGMGTSSLKFVPATGFKQYTHVTLSIPGGPLGVRSAGGGLLASTINVRYRVGSYQTARLDQLLAQLGYLPLTWSPAAGATVPAATDTAGQLAAAFTAPQGQFAWDSGYPARLRQFWHNGQATGLILKGAVMAFESDHGLAMDGVAGPAVWTDLLKAVARNQANTHGYTYAIANEANPETLTIWHNGHVVLHALTNTGIPASPTTIGTAPVYLRYYTQIMRGKNPDGTKYADRVYYVSYFRAGEAVHYYLRGSYGSPQSLGCVELPMAEAQKAWPYLSYGSLVTVVPGAQTPTTSPTDPTT
jgi:peptidoglycan hydrolase-like protein with peptidoglycan-binding domain